MPSHAKHVMGPWQRTDWFYDWFVGVMYWRVCQSPKCGKRDSFRVTCELGD